MKAVFADTFYWLALTNPDDSRYHDALMLDEDLAGTIITTTDVLLRGSLAAKSGCGDCAQPSREPGRPSHPAES